MLTRKWKVTVEMVTDSEYHEPETTIVSQTGDWKSGDHMIGDVCCLAVTMGSVARMLAQQMSFDISRDKDPEERSRLICGQSLCALNRKKTNDKLRTSPRVSPSIRPTGCDRADAG